MLCTYLDAITELMNVMDAHYRKTGEYSVAKPKMQPDGIYSLRGDFDERLFDFVKNRYIFAVQKEKGQLSDAGLELEIEYLRSVVTAANGISFTDDEAYCVLAFVLNIPDIIPEVKNV